MEFFLQQQITSPTSSAVDTQPDQPPSPTLSDEVRLITGKSKSGKSLIAPAKLFSGEYFLKMIYLYVDLTMILIVF